MKRYTLVDNKTGSVSYYRKAAFDLAFLFVFLLGIFIGYLF